MNDADEQQEQPQRQGLARAAAKTAAQKLAKTAVKRAAASALAAALPWIGGALAIIFGILAVIGLVILVMISFCGSWTGKLTSAGAGLWYGYEFCEAFQGEKFQAIGSYLDKGNLPAIQQ